MNVADIRNQFKQKLKDEEYTVDKTGELTIEILGASFIADEPAIIGEPNEDYIDAEIAWYMSRSTNIGDIYPDPGTTEIPRKPPPAAWKYTANEHGEINSNYGHLIYSEKYGVQFDRVINELKENPDSRRAIMIYTRPSIWDEYNENGKNDFICTNAVSYYLRDSKLHAVVQMRSNDVVFGYKNDYAWAKFVVEALVKEWNHREKLELKNWTHKADLITPGTIHWQVQNLHVYQKHFDLLSRS